MRSLLLPAVVLLFACTQTTVVEAPAAPDTTAASAEADIRAAGDQFERLLDSRNLEGVAALFADDAVVLAPNAPLMRGRSGARQVFAGIFSGGPIDAGLTPQELRISGELAYEAGTFQLDVTPPDATGPIRDEGKYLTVWRRDVNGQWKIVAHAFNSSLPVAAVR